MSVYENSMIETKKKRVERHKEIQKTRLPIKI